VPLLPPSQQHQSTEGAQVIIYNDIINVLVKELFAVSVKCCVLFDQSSCDTRFPEAFIVIIADNYV